MDVPNKIQYLNAAGKLTVERVKEMSGKDYVTASGKIVSPTRVLGVDDSEPRRARKDANQAYPEHEKLKKVSDQSQAIGEFIDWLTSEKGYCIAQWIDGRDLPVPASYSISNLLAEYFEIDQEKLEAEKRAMLSTLRGKHDV